MKSMPMDNIKNTDIILMFLNNIKTHSYNFDAFK